MSEVPMYLCIRTCLVRSVDRKKVLPHVSQTCLFSPVWIIMCLRRALRYWKALPHALDPWRRVDGPPPRE